MKVGRGPYRSSATEGGGKFGLNYPLGHVLYDESDGFIGQMFIKLYGFLQFFSKFSLTPLAKLNMTISASTPIKSQYSSIFNRLTVAQTRGGEKEKLLEGSLPKKSAEQLPENEVLKAEHTGLKNSEKSSKSEKSKKSEQKNPLGFSIDDAGAIQSEASTLVVNKKFSTIQKEIKENPHPQIKALRESKGINFLTQSFKEQKGYAFIVNTICHYENIEGSLEEILKSMLNGVDKKDYRRIAIVIGVNAAKSHKNKMEKALNKKVLENITKIISRFKLPVAIVKATFYMHEGGCAYGAMRNAVLHSNETRTMTEYFASEFLNPYISFQDFDMGSRKVIKERLYNSIDPLSKPFFSRSNLQNGKAVKENLKGKQVSSNAEEEHIFDTISRLLESEVLEVLGTDFNRDSTEKNIVDKAKKSAQIKVEELEEKLEKITLETRSMDKNASKEKEEIAANEVEEAEDPSEMRILPLMITGGYRPFSKEPFMEMTKVRLKERGIERLEDDFIESTLRNFEENIAEDMWCRDRWARLHPLLPYPPEPNLFIDATAAYKSSPLSNTWLTFSQNGAEFTNFGKKLHQYMAEELEVFYFQQLEKILIDNPEKEFLQIDQKSPFNWLLEVLGLQDILNETERNNFKEKLLEIFLKKCQCDAAKNLNFNNDKKLESEFKALCDAFLKMVNLKNPLKEDAIKKEDENAIQKEDKNTIIEKYIQTFLRKCQYKNEIIRARLLVDAQNNRHPIRKQSFLNKFSGLTIETDLSRLASSWFKDDVSKKNNTLQSHIGLRLIVDRIFYSKNGKNDTRLKIVRDDFEKLKDKFAYFGYDIFVKNNKPEKIKYELNKKLFDYIAKYIVELGGAEHNILSPEFSFAFDENGPFFGGYSGIQSDIEKTFFTHQIAIQKTWEEYLIANLNNIIEALNKIKARLIKKEGVLDLAQYLKYINDVDEQISKFDISQIDNVSEITSGVESLAISNII